VSSQPKVASSGILSYTGFMSFLVEFLALLPYLLASAVSAWVAALLLIEPQAVPGRRAFGLLMAAVSLWAFFNFLEDASPEVGFKLLWENCEYLPAALVPAFFFVFAWRFCFGNRRDLLDRTWFKVLYWTVPVVFAALTWFDPLWGLMRTNLHLVGPGPFPVFERDHGPAFWVFLTYANGLTVSGLLLWGRRLWERRGHLTPGDFWTYAAVLFPWAVSLESLFGPSPWPGHDPTTPAFTFMGLLLLASFGRNPFLTAIPLARRTVMEVWSSPILVFDRWGALVYHNEMAAKTWTLTPDHWGTKRGEAGGALEWLSPAALPGSAARTTMSEGAGGTVWEIDERPLVSHGRLRGSLVTFHDVSAFEQRVSERTEALESAYFRLSDETQHRRRTEQQLFYYSLHDSLTGLANRSLFLSRLGQALERTKRSAANPFGLILLNFVAFKQVNDRLGHGAGDEFLVQMALRLGKSIRTVDTAARAAADRFLLLLDDVASTELLQEAAERIRAEVEAPLALHGTTLIPSVRMGLLMGNAEQLTPEAALDDAEIALHRAALDPSQTIVVFDPAWKTARRDRRALKEDLSNALIQGHLHLVYQPVVDLASGSLRGFEALTRWTHPTRGLVPPDLFIPLAEQEGSIRPLGLWVLREASRLFVELGRRYPSVKNTFVAVNVSPLQLAEPDFATILLSLVDREGLSPERLHLEITETALVENSGSLLPVLRTLRQQGIKIKLDDFGTGYSSLHSLHLLPVDTLKIDKSFVSELPRGKPILRTIVGLAAELGLDVVAEGVETPGQRESLANLGCGFGQGFLFSPGWTKTELREQYDQQTDGPQFLDPIEELP